MNGYVNTTFRPDLTDYTAPQNRLAPWSNWEGDGGVPSNDYWLEQARRLAANPEDYGRVEPLPGITSGAPPKPWGLDRTQLPQPPPPQPMRSLWAEGIAGTRPGDSSVDPRALLPGLGPSASPVFKIWRGGNVLMPSHDTRRDRGEFSAMRWLEPSAWQVND